MTSKKPSAQILEKASNEITIDYTLQLADDGSEAVKHELVLRRPNVIASHYFPTLFDTRVASNTAFLSTMIPLMYVKSLDGNTVATFKTETDVLVLLEQLGSEGKDALDRAFIEHFLQPQLDLERVNADIKK